MKIPFQLESRVSITGLHISLQGSFSEVAAEQLLSCLTQNPLPHGRIFLDVSRLDTMVPEHGKLLWSCIDSLNLQNKDIFFKGEQGLHLGKEGCRILIQKKSTCKCNGKCKTCSCKARIKKHKKDH